MKRSLFSLAVASLAVTAAVPAFAQINTGGIDAVDNARGVFNLAEAYPCTVQSYGTAEAGVTDQQVFTGTCPAQTPAPAAAPGILCLQKHTGTEVLDVNCFAVTPSGEFGCVVQAYRFFKMVPGSFKCPDVYGVPHFDSKGNILFYTYIQFGSGIRTWWSLNFTQPGTRFLLQVISACQLIPTVTTKSGDVVAGTQQVVLHKDSWRWRVTADVNTLLNVIELMHGGAVSTLEVPCIIGEDMFDALVKAQGSLKADIDGTSTTRLTDIANDLFNMEALIVANCLFVEVLDPTVAFPGPMQFGAPNIQPPGNAAPTVTFGSQGSAVAGIIDTIEHPCCCKLLVDLEWIAIQQGIIGQNPTLPVF